MKARRGERNNCSVQGLFDICRSGVLGCGVEVRRRLFVGRCWKARRRNKYESNENSGGPRWAVKLWGSRVKR